MAGHMEPWLFWIGMAVQAVLTIAAVTFVSFFKGYGGKKGENLATHEDINRLVADLKATTLAVEAIKQELSEASWTKQRNSELRKEILFDAINEAGALELELLNLEALQAIDRTPERDKLITESNSTIHKSTMLLWKHKSVIAIVCATPTIQAVLKLCTSAAQIGLNDLNDGGTPAHVCDEFRARYRDVLSTVRSELNVPERVIARPVNVP